MFPGKMLSFQIIVVSFPCAFCIAWFFSCFKKSNKQRNQSILQRSRIWKIHIDSEKYYIAILLEIIIFLNDYFKDKYCVQEILTIEFFSYFYITNYRHERKHKILIILSLDITRFVTKYIVLMHFIMYALHNLTWAFHYMRNSIMFLNARLFRT